MAEAQQLDHESSGVRTHLTIVQGVIQRMAENSRSCKVWCVTLVSAILVLVAQTGDSQHALIALAPTALFFVLDAYYLALERGFRESYGAFVDKVHTSEATARDLYAVAPSGSEAKGLLWAMFRSLSVLPFYIGVAGMVILVWCLIL